MIRIVHSTNRAEVEALLKPTVIRDQATEKKAATIEPNAANRNACVNT